MSDVTLLRKLTEKSILKFGKYSDVPICNLLALKKYSYLRYIYFSCSNITFFDSILLEIGITEEFIIDKPGVNIEFHRNLNEIKRSKMFFKSKLHIDSVSKYSSMTKRNNFLKVDKKNFSKSSLTRKNHGH